MLTSNQIEEEVNCGILFHHRSTKNINTERVGFEPTVPGGTTVFETVRFNHSRTSPVTVFKCLDCPPPVSP